MIKDCNQKPAENRHLSQDSREKRGQTDQWDSVSAENAALLETLRALAPVVTPGPLCTDEDPTDDQAYEVLVVTNGVRSIPGTWVMRAEHNWRDADYGERRISWKEATANASATALLLSNLPAIIAALEVAELVRDEDWLASQIPASSRSDAYHYARAIIAGLEKETA